LKAKKKKIYIYFKDIDVENSQKLRDYRATWFNWKIRN